jgi:hypothetical protein
VKTGLDYQPKGRGPERRAEPGDVVDDLPTKSVSWLLEQGHIEPEQEATDAGAQ